MVKKPTQEGWSNLFVSKQKYHMIIPMDDGWNKPMDDAVFDLQTHLLHGLIHCISVKDACVKVVAAFGMAFLRNKSGAAEFLKPVPHPLGICDWSALRVTEC
ncbi:hypothetical protein TIFTF001_018561 [Ficus carica]|uniref:Uncharacterized protein n=1 Tax=Ficus carica TaxID=3494 RepID=A0AA88DAV6_FICCA|nr:hypothetical protein TIFTF001_018561 [Ficus carica]